MGEKLERYRAGYEPDIKVVTNQMMKRPIKKVLFNAKLIARCCDVTALNNGMPIIAKRMPINKEMKVITPVST